MGRRLLHRPHLEETHLRAGARRLPRRFNSREATADDVYFVHTFDRSSLDYRLRDLVGYVDA